MLRKQPLRRLMRPIQDHEEDGGTTCLVLFDGQPPSKEERERIKREFDRQLAAKRFEQNEIDSDAYGHC